jgi:hypothetical protein
MQPTTGGDPGENRERPPANSTEQRWVKSMEGFGISLMETSLSHCSVYIIC